MVLKRFNKLFGIQDSEVGEKEKFVQRINQTIFDEVEELGYPKSYEDIFRTLCYWLGINADDRISRANRMNYSGRLKVPSLRTLTGDEFVLTLKVLFLLYKFFSKQKEQQEKISSWIEGALFIATIDLGIQWKNGMFYPSGAKELDKKLIEETYEWLADYPDEKKDFITAISHYTGKKHGDVVSNSYLVIEGLARKVLKNNKTLDNNREELMKSLSLSQQWKSLLLNYINYANEFKRHASDKRGRINPIEVEAFLYLTGLLARLIIQSKNTR